jgi:exopolysaccharide biosynthesis polyprenyl glycosylphosphotransferase
MIKHIPKNKIILAGGDCVIVLISFYICYALRTKEYVHVISDYTCASFLSLFLIVFTIYLADIYSIKNNLGCASIASRLAVALIIAYGLIAAFLYGLNLWYFSRIALAYSAVVIFSFMLAWRLGYYIICKYHEVPSRVLVIGAGSMGRFLCGILSTSNDYEIVGYLDDDDEKINMNIGSSKVIGRTSELLHLVETGNINEIVIAINEVKTLSLFRELINIKFSGIEVSGMLGFCEKVSLKVPVFYLSDSWLSYAEFYGISKNIYNTIVKNAFDKIAAVSGIVALFPLMIIVSIAIKIDSRGPAFFKQERGGEGTRVFQAHKFRTMEWRNGSKSSHEGSMTISRVTRIGKILRFFRIDEIPQLWNVLMGDMSVIGPRALVKEEVRHFSDKVPYFSLRHAIKPGITGWAQVNYRHGANVEDGIEKLQYDLYYIKNLSIILDLHIIVKTIRVMCFGKGAR